MDSAPPETGWSEFLIHRLDCAQGLGNQLLTDREALAHLAEPEVAVACPVCRPDLVLRHLTGRNAAGSM
ncbi:DUF6233 domain-containing protein [Streptomyces chattanoogensis]|uniref:DUF6233 domain-containing protein n=1 Tax=Streptomyces chattanoogensis TaxID=66876 RepID=UPI0036C2D001